MRKYLFLILIFLSSHLSAEQSITPYLTSENDTLSLVEGIVNAYNGKLVQIDKDIEIQGTESFELIRYYDGGHHFISQYGYGVGFSLPIVLVFDPYSKKQNVLVEQRGGSRLLFNAIKQKNKHYVGKVEPDLLKSGYTNCCESLLQGETDISAMTVDGTESEFVVDLGNGAKRHYQYFYKDEYKIRYYRLAREERSSGNTRHFNYTDGNSISPKRIWTSNKSNSLTLNWINFNYEKDNRDYTVTASNGQEVFYQLEQKKGTAKWESKNSGYKIKYKMYLLAGVSGSHLLPTQYDSLLRTRFEGSLFSTTKVRRPDGRSLNIDYDKCERVEKLSLSGVDTPLYTFDYHKDHTIVTDALGNSKRFDFNKRRLTKLTEPHHTQHYCWSDNGQLLSHTIINPNGITISKREYSYDTIGNIVETKVTGNITHKGSQDCYVVRYVYSQDGRNNVLSENHNCEREFTYTYLSGTNLVTRKLTFADQGFVEREFNQYDQNGILIQKIIDDGGSPDVNNLANVSYRRITDIEPQLNPNLPGMTLPRVIKEWYVDPKTGQHHFLKMVEKSYTQGDLLEEEKVYDSNSQYSYSLFFEYNHKRELVREIDPLGQETIYQYDENGNKIYEEKFGSNKKTTYIYDSANRLIEEIEEHENGTFLTTSHTYDAMSNKVSTTNHFGQTTTFQFDAANREVSSIDPLGQSDYKEYDAQGNVIKEIDKDGYPTHTTYNLYGKPLEITYPDETTKRFAYNLQDHLIQEWERDGESTVYEVDYQGRPKALKIYGSDGNFLKTMQKNYKGPNLISEVDAMGNVTTYNYDGSGRKTAKIQGDQSAFYEYDSLGRLSKTRTVDSVEVKIYDFLDRAVEERTEDLSGTVYKKAQFSYDINGNQKLKKIYRNADNYCETKTIFNSENQLIANIDALGNQTIIIYHYTDHLEKEIIDPLGRKEIEIYDKLNRLIAVHKVSSEGQQLSHSSFAYDGRDNKVQQLEKSLFQNQDFGIYEIRTTYDEMGQKTSETEQDEKITSYIYENGKLHQITKPDGVILTHIYDSLGRLRELISSEGTIHYRYTYDLNDNLLKVEDIIQNTTTERSYDPLNRLIFERQATGFEVSYIYDSLDRLKEMRFQGKKIVYTYSPTSLSSATRYKNSNLLYTFLQQVDWLGKAVKQTLPNGVNLSYQWDDLFRCLSITSDPFQQSFNYDNVGNLTSTSVRDSLGSYDANFSYDELNQITQETGPFDNQYAFDSLNNRRELNGENYSINGLNQLICDSNLGYIYDKSGNRISKGETHYSYDALGRLISVSSGSNTTTYKYDPFGRRIERNDTIESVQYLYQFDTEIGTCVNGNITEFRAIYGQFAPFAIELKDQVYSLVRNHRGDICVLLDKQGDQASTYRYDAFGEFSHQGAVKSPWLFSGQRYDDTTELYHFAKREYDSSTGRWLTPDPLGFADGPNLYAYVHNNPMIYVDPYGLWGESLYSWYNQSKQFCSSFSRGFVDDTTFGASSYMLGQHNNSSLTSKVGYYTGTGCSMTAGLMYGGTWLKGARYGGKAAINAYKFTRGAYTASKTTKNVMEARNVVKLAQETKPLLQRVIHLAGKNSIIAPKGRMIQTTNSSGFLGKRGWELKQPIYQPIRNHSANINGRNYSSHALDQMQNRGVMSSVIENTINNGRMFPGKKSGTCAFYCRSNNVSVIIDTESGRVITTGFGKIRQ